MLIYKGHRMIICKTKLGDAAAVVSKFETRCLRLKVIPSQRLTCDIIPAPEA